MSKPLVIYHADCSDGFGAAWAFSRFLGHDGCEWLPAKHGGPAPDVAGRRVLIADFAYPRAELLRMHEQAAFLRVLDHHKTAEADLAELDFCEFDMARSGAGMAWDWLASLSVADAEALFGAGAFRPRGERPWLIRYVEDRDLWRFALPDAQAVCKYLLTLPFDFDVWDAHLDIEPASCAAKGAAMRQYDDYLMRWTLKGTHRLNIGGYSVPAVNSAALTSELGHVLSQDEPFAAVYVMRRDGRLGFSLRSASKDAVDVGHVASLYGGGGHHCAAGFSVPSFAALVLD